MDLGSTLTSIFGSHKSIEKTTNKTDNTTEHYRSSTTNSYNKCIRELTSKFTQEITEIAIKKIEPYDQCNFDEIVELNEVYKFKEDTGERYLAGKNVLHIVGIYQYTLFAHCKTIEMWIEFKKAI